VTEPPIAMFDPLRAEPPFKALIKKSNFAE